MYGSEIRQSDPTRLASILEMAQSDRLWQPEELGAVLVHQLAAPLEFNDGLHPTGPAEGGSTFGALLRDAHPPISLLQQLKAFAKFHAMDANHVIPHEIAAVLYYGSICAAALRCGCRITELDVASLELGITRLLACNWLEESIQKLFNDGLVALKKLSPVQ
jgi:hypothetical protein